ncbi:MAG: hypothetical protein J6Z43_00270 [Clostridiales bacterium]|nr:hypothetical protein [Clostridiales bacterium]
MSKDRKLNRFTITAIVSLTLIFVYCSVLFRRMNPTYPGVFGGYFSDMSIRLYDFVFGQSSYSDCCSSIILVDKLLYDLFGLKMGTTLIGVHISLLVTGTIIAGYYLIFIISISTLIKRFEKMRKNDQKTKLEKIKVLFQFSLLLIHLFCGIAYFIIVSLGTCAFLI